MGTAFSSFLILIQGRPTLAGSPEKTINDKRLSTGAGVNHG